MNRPLAVAEPASRIAPVKTSLAKAVHITGKDGQVDQTRVNLSKGAHDEITWFAHGKETATIVFSSSSGSPFQSSVFHVPAGGSISGGPIKSDATPQSYKYTVVGPGGVNDPEVIINR